MIGTRKDATLDSLEIPPKTTTPVIAAKTIPMMRVFTGATPAKPDAIELIWSGATMNPASITTTIRKYIQHYFTIFKTLNNRIALNFLLHMSNTLANTSG